MKTLLIVTGRGLGGDAAIAVNMIKEGFSLEDTSRATGLPKAKIAQLCKSK